MKLSEEEKTILKKLAKEYGIDKTLGYFLNEKEQKDLKISYIKIYKEDELKGEHIKKVQTISEFLNDVFNIQISETPQEGYITIEEFVNEDGLSCEEIYDDYLEILETIENTILYGKENDSENIIIYNKYNSEEIEYIHNLLKTSYFVNLYEI